MLAVRRDDLGTPFPGPAPRRVVSLVPSLTEAVAATDAGLLVGATDWCSHPAGLDVARVGGTKWPDLDRVRDLAPDLVIANAEENREEDVAALRAAGIPVWVTAPATVEQALTSLDRLCAVLGRPGPEWLRRVHEVWADPPQLPAVTAVVPIWRRPWMVLGRDTFAGDVLAPARRPQRVRRLMPTAIRGWRRTTRPRVVADLVGLPGRALRLHAGRRPGGVAAVPAGVRERAAPDLVRPVTGRGAGRCWRQLSG